MNKLVKPSPKKEHLILSYQPPPLSHKPRKMSKDRQQSPNIEYGPRQSKRTNNSRDSRNSHKTASQKKTYSGFKGVPLIPKPRPSSKKQAKGRGTPDARYQLCLSPKSFHSIQTMLYEAGKGINAEKMKYSIETHPTNTDLGLRITKPFEALLSRITEKDFENVEALELKIIEAIVKQRIFRDEDFNNLYEMLNQRFPHREPVLRSIISDILACLDS